MKKALLIISLAFIALSANSQVFKLSNSYVQNEANAKPVVKEKLSALRKEITAKKLQFIVGYTSRTEYELEKITGLVPFTPEKEKKIKEILESEAAKNTVKIKAETAKVKINEQAAMRGRPKELKYVYGSPSERTMDLRKAGLVTPVRNQGYSGTCWAFSVIAAYESSYMINFGRNVNFSEGYIASCFPWAGDWYGGWPYIAMLEIVRYKKHVKTEETFPYTPQLCSPNTPASIFYADSFGWADTTHSNTSIASVGQIKETLCRHGALSTCMLVDDLFKSYAGGYYATFKTVKSDNPRVNHAVTIVGWDDDIQCWLVKNSWGDNWGSECGYGTEKGYVWVKYDSNNIGSSTLWINAIEIP